MSVFSKPSQHPRGRRLWWIDLSSAALALLLAIVVWIVAVYEQDPPMVDSFQGVPIKYINRRDDLMLVGSPAERANLTLRAPKSLWASKAISPDVVEVVVDLQGLDEGVHNVEVAARSLHKTALVESCSPARAVVRLEEMIQRELPVDAEIADPESMPLGYAAGQPKASPDKATVSGPRSQVEKAARVVARVWLRGSNEAVETPVNLVALDAQGETVSGVQVTPAMTTVRLGVEALAEFRDVSVRAVLDGNPAAGYWISNITVEPTKVMVQGRPEIIRVMASVISTTPIDVTGVTESFLQRVSLNLPEGVSIYSADTSAQSVQVHVEVTPIVGGKTVQPKIEWLGLRSGYVVNITPDTVDVILSGPLPELQALQVEDVRVVVNMFGLGEGRFELVPTVQLPDDSNLKVERFSPDAVEVTITQSVRGTP